MRSIDLIDLQTEIEVIEHSIENAKRIILSQAGNNVGMHRHKKLLIGAANEIGVKEYAGAASNPQIQKYFSYARKDNDLSKYYKDQTPWCAAFLCYVLEVYAGMQSTNALNARSFLQWGTSVKRQPAPGDVVVFWRGSKSGWQGHVGIYLKENAKGDVLTLGGNQSDAVNCSWQDGGRVLDIRRSRLAPEYTAAMAIDLENIVDDIVEGKKILVGGSVV